MPVYRGPGGAGDATNDATISAVQTYATQAATSATQAATSATDAATSASGAATSATNAANSATTAAGSVTTAAGHASSASTFATNSSLSADDSAASALEAEGYASEAFDYSTAASSSASAAATSATNAGTSATNAAGSASAALAIYGNTTAMNAAVASATASASSASTSASTATTQASNAASSASTATTQAGLASASATSAGNSSVAASLDANEAQAAAIAAQSSVNDAVALYGSLSNIQQAEANSLANKNAASASATSASTSASTATTQAGIATTQATNAATSAAQASAVALGNEPVRHSVRPSLLLDFANAKQLDPRITFSRPTTAKYYDGKTTVKAEENLVTNSEQFDASSWGKSAVTVTANSTTAPNGTTTADTINAAAGTAQNHYWFANLLSSTGVVGTAYTHSVYAQAGTHSFFQMYVSAQTNGWANFNLTTGALGTVGSAATASITSVGGGWYRCSITVTQINADLRLTLALIPSSTATLLQTWDTVGTETVYLWGAQLEQRSTVTAYTPTTTAPITNYIPVLLTQQSNESRFDHNPTTGESLGLLIEEQRTNLLTYSEQFDNAAWTKSFATILSNTTIAPDGTLTGEKIVEDTTTNYHRVEQNATVISGSIYTLSFYAKAAERTWCMAYEDTSFSAWGYFNLQNGTVGSTKAGTTSTIQNVGNGWYRCTITYTQSGTTGRVRIASSTGDISGSYLGNGYSGIYIWGAQLEAGSFATSYIPTVASQVTRSADSAEMTSTNFTSWFNQAEGTIYSEMASNMSLATAGVNKVGWQIDSGSGQNNRFNWNHTASSMYVGVNGTGVVSFDNTDAVIKTFYKNCFAYKTDDFANSFNGAAAQTDSAGSLPIVSRLRIGDQGSNDACLNGPVKKLAYYGRRLSNAELQGLTTI